MKFYKFILFIYLILFLGVSGAMATSIERQLDSLENILDKLTEDNASLADRLDIVRNMYEITKISNDQMALEYAGQAINMILDEGDSSFIGEWYELTADIYYERREYYMAMQRYFEAYATFHSRGEEVKAAYALMSVGDTYIMQNFEEMAYSNFKNADSLFRENNCMEGHIQALNNIGLAELRKYQYDKAMTIFNQSLAIAQEIKNLSLIASVYRNMANVYDQNDDFENEEKYLNLAVTQYRMAGDKYEMAKTYYLIGSMYFRNDDYENAYTNFLSACSYFKQFGEIEYVASVFNRLGRIRFIQGDYKASERQSRYALRLSNDYNWLSEKANALLLLSDICRSRNKIDSAYYYLSEYTKVKEIYQMSRTSESFTEFQVMLTTQAKESQLAIAEQTIKRNQLVNGVIFAFSIVVALFLIYVFYNFRKSQRVNALLTKTNEEIKQKNEEITRQKNIVDNVNAEIRLQNAEIEAFNESISSSINYAGRIQHAMLPDVEFIKKHFADGFVYFYPKEVVSGDFYWFSEVKNQKPPSLFRRKNVNEDEDNKLIMAVIDCTGHGVPGAFMSMLGDAFLNQIVNLQKITSPEQILSELHKLVRATLQQETTENNDGMDAAIIMVDKSAKILKFSGAKNPLIYVQDGKQDRIPGDYKSIGGMQLEDERNFTCHELDISVPTSVYIFSDGYQDQFGGERGRKFMAKRFRELLFDISSKPFDEQGKVLLRTFNQWRGDTIQMDDTTILGVKIS